MAKQSLQADVVIVGAGLAGIVAALELLDGGRSVLLLDRDTRENLGGLARESFGGISMIGTPQQKRGGIRDTPDQAFADWTAFGEIPAEETWPRRWVREYVDNSYADIYRWLTGHGVRFFPVVHWVERGLFTPGNSVPRFHMVWGTGYALIETLVARLLGHRNAARLDMRFRHRVEGLAKKAGRVVGVTGRDEDSGAEFTANGAAVILAAGGYSGGDLKTLRANWYPDWGKPPPVILNGSHQYADGRLHQAAQKGGARLTHLEKQWNYAAGVHHPHPKRPNHGLSLVPPKSALWLDATGRRIGPTPLITAFDTRYLVERVTQSPRQYSWQIMNWKIARKELAVSGSEYNDAIKNKNLFQFAKTLLLGNEKLVRELTDTCVDFVTAGSVDELAAKMNALAGNEDVRADVMAEEIKRYDDNIARGRKFHNDDQLRRIAHVRQYRGDRVRTCAFQPILAKSAMPLIAVREFILARKSLGGVLTDLSSRALGAGDKPLAGLYCVGETAGFGGGGIHGLRALEGTFLGGCVLTARRAARDILRG